MAKVVVTGGAGFIGSHLAERLVLDGFEVVVIDNLKTGRIENLSGFKDKLKFVEGDILDLELLKKEFLGAETVFHHAAIPSVPRSIEEPFETHEANSTGMLNVLIAARDTGVRRVVCASSSSVYGDSEVMPKEESMTPKPLSLYAVHKFNNEMYANLFSKLYGLETVGLRYFNVFGPRQNPNSKYAAVIPLFIKKISNGEKVVINGDGETTRDFTFVHNVVEANILASKAEGITSEVMNIACGERISLNDLVSKIGSIVGKEPKVVHTDFRVGDIKHSLASIEKAKKVIGYVPQHTFEEGLRITIGG